jgi:hypothetical protein
MQQWIVLCLKSATEGTIPVCGTPASYSGGPRIKPGPETANSVRGLHDYFIKIGVVIHPSRPRQPPPTFFPINYPLIILLFDKV